MRSVICIAKCGRRKAEGGNKEKKNRKILRFLRPVDCNGGMRMVEGINPRHILIADMTVAGTIKHRDE